MVPQLTTLASWGAGSRLLARLRTREEPLSRSGSAWCGPEARPKLPISRNSTPQELAPKTNVVNSRSNSGSNPFMCPGAERYSGGSLHTVTSTQAQMRGGAKLQFQTMIGV